MLLYYSVLDAVERDNVRQLELMIAVDGMVAQSTLDNALELAVKQNKIKCVRVQFYH